MMTNFNRILLIGILLIGLGKVDQSEAQAPAKLDIQGHRGCRGLLPENSIPGFRKAIDIGVTTLEMDAVISQDKKVLLSHEPFLSHEICRTAEGKEITEAEEHRYNLYQMTYKAIRECDCGTKPHPRFPTQEKRTSYKPLLSEVIDSVEAYTRQRGLPAMKYNIETKCTPAGDGVFHPAPAEFVDLLMAVLKEKKVLDRVTIQSFDVRTLQVARKKYPNVRLALLVENSDGPEENIRKLGFVPPVYSPNFPLLDAHLMQYARQHTMQLLPWTVNEVADIRRILALGVQGIISDYPDRVVQVAKEK